MESLSYFQLIRREFAGYSLAKFRQDVLAGLTVGAVALPLALAFGVASGADAAAGLVTGILAGFACRHCTGNGRHSADWMGHPHHRQYSALDHSGCTSDSRPHSLGKYAGFHCTCRFDCGIGRS